jgi:hypothetical protein
VWSHATGLRPSGNLAHFWSETTGGDCVIGVRNVDVEAAEIAFAFGTAFA